MKGYKGVLTAKPKKNPQGWASTISGLAGLSSQYNNYLYLIRILI
jgi:hypothetical protein